MPAAKIYRFFLYAWLMLILTLTFHQFYLESFAPPSPQDIRGFALEKQVRRGGIYDRSGELIADTPTIGGKRHLYDNSFLYSVGYHLSNIGETGIELRYTRQLGGRDASADLVEAVASAKGDTLVGADVITTLDIHWQMAAVHALGGRKGAIVVLNPETGEILSLVSEPSFDPDLLGKEAKLILDNPDAPLLNRATAGLYPPGSLFKLIVASAAIRYHQDDHIFECKGETVVDGKPIRDAGGEVHGRLGIAAALKYSCNSYFIQMGLLLGPARLRSEARRWGLGSSVDLPVPSSKGNLPLWGLSPAAVGSFAIGQSELLATPLQMARAFGVIASGGWLRPVHLVKEIRYPMVGGEWPVYPGRSRQVISGGTAKVIRNWLSDAVSSGTGSRAYISGLNMAGKTGTAETGDGRSHAWFCAVAEAGKEKRVILVLVEHG
ncbi:MAG TPA: penicillin-binding transpeptidase domain-containing protein, partial [Bacillota bacterium]|nr:penicillin-binding transpeptidase domain-containing protein [Bacillota bacterium]